MSNEITIINKYATAAFKVAKKHQIQDILVSDVNKICQITNPIIKELANPAISKQKLQEVISEAAKKLQINQKTTDFVLNIADSRRINLLNKILEKIELLVKKDKKIIQAQVTSSRKLTNKNIESIKNVLMKKYQDSTIEIKEEVKKEIIGGIIIQIGSLVIDSSIKNQLSNIYAECKSAI